MSFEDRGESVIAAMEFDELKLVYRILHQHLGTHPELMDTDFLIELQSFLQRRAVAQGVDIADHSQWDTWIGHADAQTCDDRNARRRIINDQD